jgi:sulfonate transport system substrate-binding protein
MKKRMLFVVLMLSLAVLLSAGGTKESSSGATESGELPVLKVGMIPYLASLGVEYAMNNGFDVEQGFKIEPYMFPFGGPLAEAIGAERIDVGTSGSGALAAIINYESGMIAQQSEADYFIAAFVRPGSPIASVKGANSAYPELLGDAKTLKGATVLVTIGTNIHYMFLQYLDRLGLKESDVKIVNMDVPQCFQAFEAGEGDIVCTSTPSYYLARDREGWVEIANLKTLGVPLTDMTMATKSAMDNKGDLIVKFLKAVLKANNILMADDELRAKTIKDFNKNNGIQIDEPVLKAMVDGEIMITSEQAKKMEFAGWLRPMGEYFVGRDVFESDAFEEGMERSTDSFLREALKDF